MARKKRGANCPKPRPGYRETSYWQSDAYNQWLFDIILDEMIQLATTRIEWHNLPATCDERYLEYTLLYEGRATLAKAPTGTGLRTAGAIYSLKVGGGAALTMYGVPSQWRAIGSNGTNFPVNSKTGVIVYDNSSHHPIMDRLVIYAREIADIYRTRQINRLHSKIPWLLKVDQDHVNDAVNLFANVAGNEPATIVERNFGEFVTLEAVNLGSTYLGEELDAAERSAWNRVYATLGISNVTAKAERMIEDEVLAQDEPASLLALDPLVSRRTAAERANQLFGLDLLPVWRRDYTGSNFNVAHDIEKRMEVLSNVA